MTPETFDAVVAGFYDAAAHRIPWSGALDRFAQALDLVSVDIGAADRPALTPAFHHGGGTVPAQARLDLLRTWRLRFPGAERSRQLPVGGWFHDFEHFDDAFVAKEPFYQDFLIPYGGRYLSITKLSDVEQRHVMLMLVRGPQRGPLTETDIAQIERLRAHLLRALEMANRLKTTDPLPLPGGELLDQFSRPMVLVDERCGLMHANAAARAFLEHGDPAVVRNDMVALRQPEDDRRLRQAVQQPMIAGSSIADPRRIINARRVADGTVVTVLVLSVAGDPAASGFGAGAAAVLTFVDPYAARPLDASLVAQAFDLTAAESRVAIQLAQGLTIATIAEKNGVSMATVRTQLKALFAKTGTNRQADLVRLVTTLPEVGTSAAPPHKPPRRR